LGDHLPKISIVTPSFNQAPFLEAAIDSVLSQKYPNLEYIVVDGGSTDGSVEIIRRYEKHLHYWCSEPDRGQYDAINKGFARSTGEIMAWINSDDMYFPFAFRTVASIFSTLPEVEWLTTLTPGFWDYHGFSLGYCTFTGFSKRAFLDGHFLPPGYKGARGTPQQESTFWRRSLWERSGGCLRTEFKLAADFDLWARFYQHAELYTTPSPLGGFRFQNSNRSRTAPDLYGAEAEKALAEMRKSCNWRNRVARKVFLRLNLYRLPVVRGVLGKLFDSNYTCRRIVRENRNTAEGYWKVEIFDFQ